MRFKILGLIFVAIVVVASVIFIWLANKEESSYDAQINSSEEQQTSLKEIKAEQIGEMIAKSTNQDFNHIVTTTSGNSKIVNVFNFQQKYASLKTPNKEAIAIGNTAFVKDSNNQWWKKDNAERSELPIYIEDYKNTLDSYSKLSFKFLGEDNCEPKRCFVYSAIDSKYNIETKFWFEADSKLLRKTEAKVERHTATVTFEYNKEELKPPPNTKSIPSNEPVLNYLGSKQDNSWSEEKKQQKLKELEELRHKLGEIE